MESSYSGSSKRAKAIIQMAHCLVDGCNADLSLCRDYHRRHKVCEVHSKTSKVTIGGREQRFCQQCSRFHSLVEFDDGKRSCRKRLDGHNRRRRKPQTNSLQRNSSLFFSTQQGSTRLSFGTTPQVVPGSVMSSSWTGIVKPNNNIPHVTPDYIGLQTQQLQFMQGVDQDNKAKIIRDGLSKVVDSDRVLSLLSTRPTVTVTRELGSNRVVEPEPLLQAVHDLQYGGLNHYSFITSQENKARVSSHSEASTLHFPQTFHHVPQGSSSSGSHQTLSFMWE